MFRDARVYVAGHTGLLGSALVRRLDAMGRKNVVTRTRAELDLADAAAVRGFFERERPDLVFFAAGATGGIAVSRSMPATLLHKNAVMQSNVFDAACSTGARHIVYYGSSCIYPANTPQPIREESVMTGPFDETVEGYATAKFSGLMACKVYNREFGAGRFIALVPNTLYGPNDRFDVNSHVFSALIARFHEAKATGASRVVLWGTGAPRREFIFSEDVADFSLFMVENASRLDNTHYNCGTGVDYSIAELARLIADEVGYGGEIAWDDTKPDGVKQKLLDSSRAMALGWRPSTPIEQGLKRTYDWYVRSKASGIGARRGANG